MVDELLKAVSNAPNRSILGLLAVEASYPRRIAILLGLPEGEVARRLRRLERLGLVAGKWSHVGKNVKLYSLATETVTLRIAPGGVEVDFGRGQSRPAATTPVAANIPAVAGFVGRETELALLDGPEAVVLVLGMPGAGKTTLLAQHVARQAGRPAFWRCLRGVESVTWLANQVALFLAGRGERALLETLEERDGDPAGAAEACLAAMEASGAVFVLDDVHTAKDPAVRAFLADAVARIGKTPGAATRLLVGSREWIAHDPSRPGLRILRLQGLGDREAVELLRQRGVEVPDHLVPRLRAEAGGHPLALNLLAQAAAVAGLESLLDRVPEADLETWLLSELDDHLADDERLALSHASLFRTPFGPADLTALSGKRLEGALTRLRRRMLVQDVPGGHALAEVVQNFYHARLQDRKVLHAKAARHALAKGTIESRLEAMHHFLAAGERAKVLELVERNLDLHDYAFIGAGYHHLYDAVLSAFRREDVSDNRHWALIQDEKGDLALHAGDPPRALAHYQEAATLLRAGGDAAATADASWKGAVCLERLGRAAEAASLCAEALAAAPEGPARQRLAELQKRLQGPPLLA